MSISTSILEALLQALPQLRSQIYFKSSLTALSHAMEDQVLAGGDRPLIIASFQRERFYRQEAHRYQRISEQSDQVYVLAAPETNFTNASGRYETVAFEPEDQLSHEWHLVVLGSQQATCLICREREPVVPVPGALEPAAVDQSRQFEGIWTFDRCVSQQAAAVLLDRILLYRPELAEKIEQARDRYGLRSFEEMACVPEDSANPGPFAERLVTYLQAGQYKLLKAYRSIAAQERKERLVNSITTAIRRSLNPSEIFTVAADELGQALKVCRCLIYRCKATDTTAKIQYEFLGAEVPSARGQTWPLADNALFQEVLAKRELLPLESTASDPRITEDALLRDMVQRWQIGSWLLVPISYQGRLVGMVELHGCSAAYAWTQDDLSLVDAIAGQLGVALIQAEAFANLEDLNQQLEALERTRSNLIAITGHELRTPLSTIQVCLESLATEPDMPLELRQVMLNSALADAERMRELVQDFLTLSRLESGRVEWHLESLPMAECVDLALSSVGSRQGQMELPTIVTKVALDLPLVQADGEWLVEVLSKLLDNACKFTETDGQVSVEAYPKDGQTLEVIVTDTGRGIEPNRLEAIFDRFYQEEGALRRTAGGTGLGLAICRQIIAGLGGRIWAESAGRGQGSRFHFTVPIAEEQEAEVRPPAAQPARKSPGRSRGRRTTLRSSS